MLFSLSRCARRSFRGGFGRAEGGMAAVEFALVAVPFLGIICATIETAVDYWAQLTLDAALSDAARSVYTGTFQSANAGGHKSGADLLAALRDTMCTVNGKPRPTMFVCQNVRLSLTTSASFTGSSSTNPTAINPATGQTGWNASYSQYACAKPSQIVRVQAAVDFPVFFNLLHVGGNRLANGSRVLQSAAVFQVEPYANAGACS